MLAIAFLPAEIVENALNELTDTENDEDVLKVYDYFNENYVSGKIIRKIRNTKCIRNPPLFPIEEWNVYSRNEEDIDRTTNCQESYHNYLKVLAGKDHVKITQLIILLKNESKRTEHRAKNYLINGLQEPKRRKKSVDKKTNILRLHQHYATGIINQEDFLFAIKGNLYMAD